MNINWEKSWEGNTVVTFKIFQNVNLGYNNDFHSDCIEANLA